MGFWSTLGKGLKLGASVGTSFIPGVGPVASKALDKIGTAGDVLSNIGRTTSGAATGALDQRLAEAQLNQGSDRNAMDRARLAESQGMDRASLGVNQNTSRDAQALQRAQMGIDAPMARTKQAAFGDALHNVQDVNFNFQPKTGSLPNFNITGGLRPSLFGANARNAGSELSRQALLALMTKSDVPSASSAIDMPAAGALPTLQGPTHSGALEKTLGGVGLGSSILGGLGQALKNRPAMPTMADMPTAGAPQLSPGDVAYGRGQSPQLLPQDPQQAYVDPNLLDPTRQQKNPYGGVRF